MSVIIQNKLENMAIQRFGKILGRYSVYFRSLASAIEADPDIIFEHVHHESIQTLCQLRTLSALEFFYLYEALSYGDIGVLFASPRTCLSGILMQWIGTADQQEEYFDYIKTHCARTFFASTEPEHDSDASQMKIHFDIKSVPEKVIINGEKILVGNLGIAKMGVVIGRTGDSLLNMMAAWVKPKDFTENAEHVKRETLPLFGIKAALLGYAKFNEFTIPKSQLLGEHISPMARGLQAVIKTFNIMRLGIAGIALGHAQSVLDYITINRSALNSDENSRIERWQQELFSLRALALEAGKIQQKDPLVPSVISLIKMQSSQLAEKISTQALNFFGENVIFEHPFLMKRLRDCFWNETS